MVSNYAGSSNFLWEAVAYLINTILIEVGIGLGLLIFMDAIIFYVVNEIISITESRGIIGLSVPKKV
jgi:phage-related holin